MQIRWAPVGLLCFLLVHAAAAAARPAKGPFRVPREQVLGKRHTLALAPLWVPDDLIVDRVDRAQLLELVARRLAEGGVAVIPPSRTGPILEAAAAAHGGYHDDAGKVDERRYLAAVREALTALRERTGADRLLVVALTYTDVPVSAGLATWDGVEEDAAVPLVRRSGKARTGKLWAISVGAWIHGDRGEILYENAGGLRLLYHYARNEQRVPVPDADVLADESRNERAVRIALEPLLSSGDPERTAAAAVPDGSSP